jgi:hypothetical protein
LKAQVGNGVHDFQRQVQIVKAHLTFCMGHAELGDIPYGSRFLRIGFTRG